MANSQATWLPGDHLVRVTEGHKKQGDDQQPGWGIQFPHGPMCAPNTWVNAMGALFETAKA